MSNSRHGPLTDRVVGMLGESLARRQWPQPFPNWFVAQKRATLDIVVGTPLLTGHESNATAGNYVVMAIDQVDADTVTITVKRTP